MPFFRNTKSNNNVDDGQHHKNGKSKGKNKKATKTRFSRWLITINANRKTGSYPGGEETLRARLALCAKIFERGRLKPYLYILRAKETGHTFEQNVGEVHVESNVEKRTQRGFLHVHIYVSVSHTTSCRLSYPVIRAACAKILGVPKPHFDAKLVKGGETIEQVRAYVMKGGKGEGGKEDVNDGGSGDVVAVAQAEV